MNYIVYAEHWISFWETRFSIRDRQWVPMGSAPSKTLGTESSVGSLGRNIITHVAAFFLLGEV